MGGLTLLWTVSTRPRLQGAIYQGEGKCYGLSRLVSNDNNYLNVKNQVK